VTRILGFETSCDETAVAVVRDGIEIESNVIASQTDMHARFGGVVPEQASRAHLRAILPCLDEAFSRAHADWDDIDAIAVTHGPGLAGALLVGVNFAKFLDKLPDYHEFFTFGTVVSLNGSSNGSPPLAGAISIRSPAPKLWIAVTVPSTAPSAVTAARPSRSAW